MVVLRGCGELENMEGLLIDSLTLPTKLEFMFSITCMLNAVLLLIVLLVLAGNFINTVAIVLIVCIYCCHCVMCI